MHKSQIKSQTTPRLYQHPTQEEMSPKSNLVSNFFALLIIGILISFTVYITLVKADKEALVKEQNQAQVRAEVVK